MSLGRALAQGVAGIGGLVSPDQIDDADLDTLAEAIRAALNAVESERADRLAARCGRLPVSHPWPEDAA